jgi:hypothetical protein
MNLNRTAVATLLLFLGTSGACAANASGGPQGAPPPGYGYGQDRDQWDAPPHEYNEFQRQGFHDGLEGARKDYENHRRPDPDNRDEYRHPHVPPDQVEAYREGFRRGYREFVTHSAGAPVAAPRGDWDTAPDEFSDIQRRGFHDGMEGARKDYENHRRPDVNNRDEYRHPDVPSYERDAYRQGFERGYNRTMAHLMGQPWQY